jgi:hypothetical protein
MCPGSSDFKGAFDMLLPFDIDKILTVRRLLSKQDLHIADRWRKVVSAIEETDGLGKCRHCIDG